MRRIAIPGGAGDPLEPRPEPIAKPGDPAALSVTAPGAGSFQWKLDDVNVVNGGGVSGATTATLNISSVDESDEGVYTCAVADGCILVTTNEVTLTVLDPVSITSQPVASDSACTGETTIITVAADGDNLTYQWRKDGIPLVNGGNISGANGPNLSISNLDLSDQANSPGYTCFISDTWQLGRIDGQHFGHRWTGIHQSTAGHLR